MIKLIKFMCNENIFYYFNIFLLIFSNISLAVYVYPIFLDVVFTQENKDVNTMYSGLYLGVILLIRLLFS